MKPLTFLATVIGPLTRLRIAIPITATCLGLALAGCNSAIDSNIGVSPMQSQQEQQETTPVEKVSSDVPPINQIPALNPPKKIPGNPAKSALDDAVQRINDAPISDSGDPTQENTGATAEIIPPHDELLPLIEKDWVRLHPQFEVWLDNTNKQVIVGGRICFRNGPLEMFACPHRTKEHESIVSTVSNGEIVHVGLLATGATPGKPVQWDPDFVAASGPVVHITVVWTEDGTRKEVRAQEMITDMVTNEPLRHEFVYCGSGEWRDPENPSYREFWADSGDLICVSNFSTALMDLQIESSSAQGGLMFHANPDKIPELGKPVLLMLQPEQPKLEQPKSGQMKPEAESPKSDK